MAKLFFFTKIKKKESKQRYNRGDRETGHREREKKKDAMENYGPTNTNATTTANRPDFGPTSWEEMNDEEKKKRATGICCYNLLGLVSTAAFICGYVSLHLPRLLY